MGGLHGTAFYWLSHTSALVMLCQGLPPPSCFLVFLSFQCLVWIHCHLDISWDFLKVWYPELSQLWTKPLQTKCFCCQLFLRAFINGWLKVYSSWIQKEEILLFGTEQHSKMLGLCSHLRTLRCKNLVFILLTALHSHLTYQIIMQVYFFQLSTFNNSYLSPLWLDNHNNSSFSSRAQSFSPLEK